MVPGNCNYLPGDEGNNKTTPDIQPSRPVVRQSHSGYRQSRSEHQREGKVPSCGEDDKTTPDIQQKIALVWQYQPEDSVATCPGSHKIAVSGKLELISAFEPVATEFNAEPENP